MKNVYSDLKFMNYGKTLSALRSREIVPPVHIRIKPTNICNHDCWYCAYHVSGVQLGGEMGARDVIPFDKLSEIADDIIEMGVAAVTFSGGGEPLLYKRLPEIVKKLKKGGVNVAVLTNGANLKGEMAEAFQKYGSWVRISLDGYDDVSYAKARGIKEGEFSNLMNNIKLFTSSGTECVLGCSYIVSKDNYEYIYDICLKLKNAGANHVKISGVVIGNTPEENNKYHNSIKSSVQEQLELVKKLVDNSFDIVNHYHDLEDRFFKEYNTCPYILYRPVIGADCHVYTCQDKAYTESGDLGRINEMRLIEFWGGESNQDKVYQFDPSKSCNHHCISHTKNLIINQYLSIDDDHISFT